ncbi:MAG: SCO family protein [Gemmatimonadaceae bacterium]|nr:SCO family protein [Chitinophagaceae bacterium]
MSYKAFLALCVAIFLPVASYFLVKYLADDVVVMPRRYYSDSIVSKITDGKQSTDTVWHTVKDFRLVNQLGDTVSLSDAPGRVIVADFFFTHCGSICPTLTRNMKKLQTTLKLHDNLKGIDTSFVQFISFTVDPDRDSSSVLKKYADKYSVNHDMWWMLTGDKKTIYDFAFEELKVDKYNDEVINPDFVHTSRFTLIDKQRVVRGYYNGLDSMEMLRLSEDVVKLMLEKDKTTKSTIFSDMRNIWPVFVIVIIAVIIFGVINRKPKF